MAKARKHKNRRNQKRVKSPSALTHRVPVTFRRRARQPKEIDPSLAWYAVRTNIRCEHRARVGLFALGLATYLPTDLVERIRRGRKREFEPCAMPRYLFVGFPPDDLAFGAVRGVDGVESIVGINGKPYPIPARVLQAIEAELCKGYATAKLEGRYRIAEGPFTNSPALVMGHGDDDMVRVLIDIFGRTSALSLHISQLDVENPLENAEAA